MTASAGRVLLVDDDEPLRRLFSRMLSRAGFDVLIAADGETAIALLREGVDVIVSDINMPGVDGLQLLRRVREHDLDVPVILMTGAPSIESAMRAIEHGVLRYIPKPSAADQLIPPVLEAVRLRRLANAKREALALLGAEQREALALLGAETRLIGDRAGLEATFERTLESMWVAFQPIVATSERRVFAYEALLRSREAALPHPGAVLDAAERLDRLDALGRAIRDRVAETIFEAGGDETFFVNLHPRDLLDNSLISKSAPLTEFASRVVLEITERASLDRLSDVRARVRSLRDLGYRLAIDDLGAGYAGLTSFATLEPDVVKLDMSLVRGIDANPVKRKVVEKMIGLAHDLKIAVVCEGVETTEERDTLISLDCDFQQGYLFAKPGPPLPTVCW